jgi:hypothetical protein
MPTPTVSVVQGPFRRVIDQQRAGKPDPDALRDLVNGVLDARGAIVSRPGAAALGTHPGAPGQAQGIAGMELAGTHYTFAVVGGVLASYDWTADSWTVETHTGTTINVTGAVALVPYFDQLIVSDGVNRPWALTPGSGVGTYLGMSQVPWYGRPVVKDAKLSAIRADTRREWEWSEEADAMLGGGAGGYNNVWDLRQTAQGALVALVADNEAMRYLREGSTGSILGQIGDEYQASGTHDDVAQNLGTHSPFAPLLTEGGTLWSVDALGRPYRVAPGAGVDTLWLACEATVATVDRDQLAAAWGLYLPELDAVAFALPRTSGSTRNTDLLLFDRATGDYAGRWQLPGGASWAWGARCVDAEGIERLVALSHDGTPYVVWQDREADEDATKAVDAPASGAVAVATRAVLPEVQQGGAEQAAWCQWTSVILETGDPWAGSVPPVLAPGASGTALTFDTEEPGHAFGSRDARTVTVGASGRKEVGTQRWGRWLRSAFASADDDAGGARFRLWRVTWRGHLRDANARRR